MYSLSIIMLTKIGPADIIFVFAIPRIKPGC